MISEFCFKLAKSALEIFGAFGRPKLTLVETRKGGSNNVFAEGLCYIC